MKLQLTLLTPLLLAPLAGLQAAEATKVPAKVSQELLNSIHVTPKLIFDPMPAYAQKFLPFAMAASMESTSKGRLWTCWAGGQDGPNAYLLASYSDDRGKSWRDPVFVIDPQAHGLKMGTRLGSFWCDPKGRLWLFFHQSVGMFDGSCSNWYVRCDDPDVEKPQWTQPVYIGFGASLNKPIVRKNGEWILPVSLWERWHIDKPFADFYHELDAVRGANVFVSDDEGASWRYRGGLIFNESNFNEHSVVELSDGRLWMLSRCKTETAQSFSTDGGKTWQAQSTAFPHVNSKSVIRRLQSGNLLVIRHGQDITKATPARQELTAFLTTDEGKTWSGKLLLDERSGVSYPDIAQAPNGDIYVHYDRDRAGAAEILFARIREDDVKASKLISKDSALKNIVKSKQLGMNHGGPGQTATAADYIHDIRPLLRERCVSCHGTLKQEGDLRLDAGSLIPHASHAEILDRITSSDEDERMPPDGARLTAEQVAMVREWIAAGAPFPADEVVPRAPAEHWSFQPVKRPQVPRSKYDHPVDAFLFGENAAPELAKPSVLLRRAHLDLTGLPPTIEEQRRFAKNNDLPALVDDLLSRPEHGERWARHWLDVARYADSNGYERDAEKPFVWRYRDYVIEALNKDKPFDRFILEQIAGDELPDATVETHIATGFLRVGTWDDQPADPKAYRYDQLDDIVSTTSLSFLGLTIGCARCHDHKLEPLNSRDYYSLVAVFNPLQTPRTGIKELTVNIDGTEVYAFTEPSAKAPDTHILVRGSATRPGELVQPAVPAILVKQQPTFTSSGERTTGRRLALAKWIADESNPLTARVIVNRVWQHHFGSGLVESANNFGLVGAAPAHPELLDWLAHWFMHDAGWSLKKLHRLLLTSRAWQGVKSADSPVRYRRLDVEAIRDSMLAVSGRLNPKRFGPAIRPTIPLAAIEANSDKHKIWKPSEEPEASRRSIYVFIKRGLIVPMFESLDLADTASSCPKRQVTTVAPQALTLFNGDFSNEQARHLAARLKREAGDDAEKQIKHAWRLALCRDPTADELGKMKTFLQAEPLEQLCRVILNLNEFVYPE